MIATVSSESGLTESVNITEGVEEDLKQLQKIKIFLQLQNLFQIKQIRYLMQNLQKEDKAMVVMNPDFVSLLTRNFRSSI